MITRKRILKRWNLEGERHSKRKEFPRSRDKSLPRWKDYAVDKEQSTKCYRPYNSLYRAIKGIEYKLKIVNFTMKFQFDPKSVESIL